jgi:SAM-dependent methyltransferase
MSIQGMVGIRRKMEIREHVLRHGCYSGEENLRIYEKWFSIAPRYVFRAVDRKYGITKKVLCEMGCSYGMNLLHCLPDSYGVEIEEYEVQFARSLGLTVYQRDILNDDLTDLPQAEVIWCSAVLEHVDSPHSFLRKLHLCLKPHGLLALYVPTLPLFPGLRYLPKMGRYFSGHAASDHINAFIPSTLQFFCERAGFKTIEVSRFYPSPLHFFNHVPLLNRLIDGSVYVGCKIEQWEYPEKATRRVTTTGRGYVMKGQQFPDLGMEA